MSTLKVGGIRGVSASSDAITVANDGTCSANITSNGGGQLSNRNKVINGGMTISQRHGTSAVQLSASEQYIVDRFKNDTGSSFDMKADASQSTDHPDGFSNSLKLVCDGVNSPGTDGNGGISTFIEGQDVQDFGFGNSNAKALTLSFYAKSAAQNANHTYSVMVGYAKDGTAARVKQSRSFTVTASWQRFTMTFQPTGVAQSAGILNSNNYGIQIFFSLAAGSNDLVSEITTWTEAQPLVGVTGQNNFFDASGNELYITGVQLEVGSVATDFEHRSFGQELALCQRYFQVLGGSNGTYDSMSTGSCASSTVAYVPHRLVTTMRSTPSFTLGGSASDFRYTKGADQTPSSLALDQAGRNMVAIRVSAASDHLVADDAIRLFNVNTTGSLQCSAEL
jgi:hypothetical protein